jgi:hypothetical protein
MARGQCRIGASGGGCIFAIGGETYVGVNPRTLLQTVQHVKQIGRYPVEQGCSRGGACPACSQGGR